jgi:hypothetical protein
MPPLDYLSARDLSPHAATSLNHIERGVCRCLHRVHICKQFDLADAPFGTSFVFQQVGLSRFTEVINWKPLTFG